LPDGLAISPSGEISGTPTKTATFTSVVTVTATKVSGRNTTTTTFDYAGQIIVSPADAIIYTVTFESNGGTAIAPKSVAEGGVVDIPYAITREGYNFIGWFVDSACTAAYDFNDPVHGNITLYACWIKDNSSDLSTLSGDIAAIMADIGPLTTNVGSLTSTVGTLSTTVGTLSTTVGNLSTTVADLTTLVGNLTTKVDSIDASTQQAQTLGVVGIVVGSVGIVATAGVCCLVLFKKKS
jgi:uncharacterized repeat protein (TIGR02543 family)